MFSFKKNWLVCISPIILLLPLVFYGWRIAMRPSLTSTSTKIAPGIIYQRQSFNSPRPYLLHTVEIDLTRPQLQLLLSTPLATGETTALVTSEYVRRNNLDVAINGSFFYPFKEKAPWDYEPHTGDRVTSLGEQISNRKRYGTGTEQWRVLCFDGNNQAQILQQPGCPLGTVQGIAGQAMLVKDGRSLVNYESPAYSRTAVGINQKGDRLWLIVIDGKQPFYSEGVTQAELAQIAIDLGCDRALNLDGGGSTTLAVRQGQEVKVLNAPIHTKIPMRERPVANHLGFAITP